jgi:hypothetical protein
MKYMVIIGGLVSYSNCNRHISLELKFSLCVIAIEATGSDLEAIEPCMYKSEAEVVLRTVVLC